MSNIVERLEQEGFYLLRGAVPAAQVSLLRDTLGRADIARSERSGETFGARGLLQLPQVRAVAGLPAIAGVLHAILDGGFRAVRGLFFDKTQRRQLAGTLASRPVIGSAGTARAA
jgi:hypothetical protein